MLKNNLLTDKKIGSADVHIDLIPEKNKNSRPGVTQKNTYITVHNTGNANKGADAERHTEYADNNTDRAVSWHFTVDSDSIYQELPVNEKGYHAGTKAGNASSIGIEACDNIDGDWKRTRSNLIALIVVLMQDMQIPIERVVTHQSWSGKYCPHVILDEGWDKFIQDVKKAHADATKKPVVEQPKKEEEVKENEIEKILRSKLKNPDLWIKAFDKLKEIAKDEKCPDELKVFKYIDEFIVGLTKTK